MSLIAFSWKMFPHTPLFGIYNRDESRSRTSLPAHWWEDAPNVFAGKDALHHGTWLGITKNNRFAAVTNVNSCAKKDNAVTSRGLLVAEYLKNTLSPQAYIQQLRSDTRHFNGFNLLIGDTNTLIWYTNQDTDDVRNGQPLDSGIYGLANGALDAPCPKIHRAKAQFSSLLCQCAPMDTYIELLKDCTRASDCRLTDNGMGLEHERIRSSIFVFSDTFGTQSSNLVCLHTDNRPSTLVEHITEQLSAPPSPITTDPMTKGSCCKK